MGCVGTGTSFANQGSPEGILEYMSKDQGKVFSVICTVASALVVLK